MRAVYVLLVVAFGVLGCSQGDGLSDELASVTVVHVICNSVFERVGFNVMDAVVDPSGAHMFSIAQKDGASVYTLRGTASAAPVDPLYATSTAAARLDVELSDDTGRTKLWIVQNIEVSGDGKTSHSRMTATFMHDGSIPLNGYLVENVTTSITEGDTTLASFPAYLRAAPPGTVVRLERSTLTAIGDDTSFSVVEERYQKSNPNEVLANVEVWLAKPREGWIVNGEDTLTVRFDPPEVYLADSVLRFAYIVLDESSLEFDVPIFEYRLSGKELAQGITPDGAAWTSTTLTYSGLGPLGGLLRIEERTSARIVGHTFFATTSLGFNVDGEAGPVEAFSVAIDPIPLVAIGIFVASWAVSELVTHYVACCESCPLLPTKEGSAERFACEVGAGTVVGLGIGGAAKQIAAKVGYKGVTDLIGWGAGKIASNKHVQQLTKPVVTALKTHTPKVLTTAAQKWAQSGPGKALARHSEVLKNIATELISNTVETLLSWGSPLAGQAQRHLATHTQSLVNQPGFNEYRWYNQDFSWTHTLPAWISPADLESVKLTIEAWDVDSGSYPNYEFDLIYLDGQYLGFLKGSDGQWSTTTFEVGGSSSRSIFADGKGVIHIDIDSTHNQLWWAVTIGKSTMTFSYWEEE